MPNIIGIEARVVNVDPNSPEARLLPGLQASVCNGSDHRTCKELSTTLSLNRNPEIVLREPVVGLCSQTGVACLAMARILAGQSPPFQ